MSVRVAEGEVSLGEGELVLGYNEAKMMRENKLFSRVGDTIPNFFGSSTIKIVGILKPTGTLLDSYHFLNESTWAKITAARETSDK